MAFESLKVLSGLEGLTVLSHSAVHGPEQFEGQTPASRGELPRFSTLAFLQKPSEKWLDKFSCKAIVAIYRTMEYGVFVLDKGVCPLTWGRRFFCSTGC
jgi:hypothetical protein